MIRTKGEAGTGNVIEAVRHQRAVMSQIRRASVMTEEELYVFAKEIQAPFHLLKETARLKRLPVVNFAAGGIATPGNNNIFSSSHYLPAGLILQRMLR
jgi:pyridoxal 5'-phosphate synthase pdxS subunit